MTPAAALVVSLRPRGITFAVRNNRLWLLPAKAYRTLTTAERDLIRANRDELKSIARGDLPMPVADAPPPTPPRYRSALVGTQNPTISESDYPALGLYVSNGIVSHALGDEFAQRILTGDVPQEEARAMKRRADEEVRELKRSNRW